MLSFKNKFVREHTLCYNLSQLIYAPTLRAVEAGVEDGGCFVSGSYLLRECVNVFALAFGAVYVESVLCEGGCCLRREEGMRYCVGEVVCYVGTERDER
jgi:hypothetical protein